MTYIAPTSPQLGDVPASALFPALRDRAAFDDVLTGLLAQAERGIARGPANPSIDFPAFAAELEGFAFAEPVPMPELLDWTVAQLQTGCVQLTHPRYLGLFNPAPSFPAKCADRIAASFNPQLASATTSPVPVAIEAHVIRAIAIRAGLGPAATGHFTAGGSEANFTALICALSSACAGFAATGARAFAGQPVFYISADSHLAWIKIAHQAGIGRNAARLIATDDQGRMCPRALRAAIAEDLAIGDVPVMIAATAGTTNAGMVDPLEACATIAREHGLWVHVDAAWGGALLASDRLRPLLDGIEQADSITIDAHKWFATTMGCGMFLTSRPDTLSAACAVEASFMPSHTASLDPYLNSVQWSRRFSGLRLFMSLAAAGWAGHAAHVEHSFAMTDLLADSLEANGWTRRNPGALAVACLAPPAGAAPVRDIVAGVIASGAAWVSVARYQGSDVVRACVTHGETSAADIAAVAAALDQASMMR